MTARKIPSTISYWFYYSNLACVYIARNRRVMYDRRIELEQRGSLGLRIRNGASWRTTSRIPIRETTRTCMHASVT